MEAVTNLLSSIFGADSMSPTSLLIAGGLIMALIMALVMAACAIVFTWMERKVAGFIQSRYGPMRVGHWHGVAQPVADMLKILQKEDIIPAAADKPLFMLAPLVICKEPSETGAVDVTWHVLSADVPPSAIVPYYFISVTHMLCIAGKPVAFESLTEETRLVTEWIAD